MSQEKRKFSVEDTAPVSNWKCFGAQVNVATSLGGGGGEGGWILGSAFPLVASMKHWVERQWSPEYLTVLLINK
jgi:hypothetical protein